MIVFYGKKPCSVLPFQIYWREKQIILMSKQIAMRFTMFLYTLSHEHTPVC
jgi:hypothetical protein